MSDEGLERHLAPKHSMCSTSGQRNGACVTSLIMLSATAGRVRTVLVVDRHDSLRRRSHKLVLKLDEVTRSDFSQTEYARHYAAALESPDLPGITWQG